MPHEVIMPALGMAQDTGLIVSWLKRPGDSIKVGDALMEVETDKAVMEVEAQADGFLTDIAAAAGDHVPVGQVVALISDSTNVSAAVSVPQEAVCSSIGTHETLPIGEQIIMPALGMAQDTGLIVAWRKNPGDAVEASDILLEVETDKSVMEVEAGHDGYIAAILAKAQQTVPVGSVIAVISSDKPKNIISRSHVSAAVVPASGADTPNGETTIKHNAIAAVSRQAGKPSPMSLPDGRILASPKARRLALEQGLDLGRLVKHGVRQPYHVADIANLKTLDSVVTSPSAGAGLSAAIAPATLQISARVAASGCDDFIRWMSNDGNIQLEPRLVWLRFATASLREATGADGDELVVETRNIRNVDGRFIDPDRSRLSNPVSEDGELQPALIFRDFSASPITAVTAPIDIAPVLTIGRERDDYVISLDCLAGQLEQTQAIDFITGLAERLNEPLRYLV